MTSCLHDATTHLDRADGLPGLQREAGGRVDGGAVGEAGVGHPAPGCEATGVWRGDLRGW